MTDTPAYRNEGLSFAERARDLVSRMTLEEKVSQMLHTASAIPRLGVPPFHWWNEALHGVARAGTATMFPQAIGMAATCPTRTTWPRPRSGTRPSRTRHSPSFRIAMGWRLSEMCCKNAALR